MPINNLLNLGTSSANSPTSTASQGPGGNLGESAFLTLLAAELQYQNPLQPMDNTQFVAQLAQFSSLAAVTKQSTTLNDILSTLQQQNPVVQLSQLIGKTVSTAQGSGIVTAVLQQGQNLLVDVKGIGSVPVNDITQVQA
ncbi:flagellar hook capping FlgD N-terminal domain-containing protein [Sulfobacillus thermosulfidooxidans]|uniref:Flagellar basal-body rod modification protein FlgD n=1 Tax=Sulfobacillus thermosulfidooxidans (strain DSM 9293 / VKM B-1269 / AT-1) TaxID=929705 RepID=A0A1W1WEW6_SULTA|nr:flagellar hook capping FlgD N-terminal domain-containing protein [Sulfobacillus thermosulfidooxidans]OLZ11806.1 flagellar hook capping protein [Sulfobacillus thermosulfidooxidans]OLZ17056.1 flagellar hook capping protein [Sulfobacillus thermosulfidooxidans]OLZ20152.1 flagellar hook capping protein [Sulfobacillus thermosulfidooxidans]SMC04580.1 flagellar basal-body rod modification protein FlgD [Sulfobacillus thermosulfidooxidans DSM 9293]